MRVSAPSAMTPNITRKDSARTALLTVLNVNPQKSAWSASQAMASVAVNAFYAAKTSTLTVIRNVLIVRRIVRVAYRLISVSHVQMASDTRVTTNARVVRAAPTSNKARINV